MSTATERYMTVAEVADLMRVDPATVRRWIRTGRLPGHKVRGLQSVRVKESDVHGLLEPITPGGADAPFEL